VFIYIFTSQIGVNHEQCRLIASFRAIFLNLPYLAGLDVLPSSADASNGPNAHPEVTVRLQSPRVQYSLGSIPKRGTIPSQVRAYSLGRGVVDLPTNTHTQYLQLQENVNLKAHKQIHPGHHDQQNSKPGKSRRPISESRILVVLCRRHFIFCHF